MSKKIDFLLTGNNPGPSKINKALDFNVKMLKIDEFLNMLK